jgi:hypothetical protein
MFAEEKPAPRELPLEPFRDYKFGDRTVNLDGCVEVEAAEAKGRVSSLKLRSEDGRQQTFEP